MKSSSWLLMFVFLYSSFALCEASPLGRWIAHDETDSPRSIVEVFEEGDTLSAKIIEQLHARKGKELEKNCTRCEGDLKDKPKVGMAIVSGLRKYHDKWVGGKILDTDSGSTYKCKIYLSKDGQTLNVEVNAFLGLGATVKWVRHKEETKAKENV